ncbi:Abi family protein [Corallococcus sp. BB11-1]|uniref:Abi family protein n=1 Tax=Corallococcus sp. BB11-1 TaxID=2996783 RepID=UPI0010E387C8|nr:Abi family protein [Corallococcus sp. BB11-1]MCY1029859.1 Abi family protein [Corallococcus sp. BB11-1]RYZ17800.1 MAG: Abi family protein [Myxococcaceae bacterium]
MLVANRDHALAALGRISYYRLSAYWYPFRNADSSFEPGTTFEKVLELYEFDRRLRLVVLDAIERVEILARTLITYTMGHGHGAFAHTDPSNFTAGFSHDAWHQELLKEIGRAKEKFLEHFQTNYVGFPNVPIWMASEVMSLGTLSKMFKGMQTKDQQEALKSWNVHQSVAESWLHSLSYVRNVCAHHGRLWNRELAIRPLVPKRATDWPALNNKRIYAILCVLRQLTRSAHGGEAWAGSVRNLLAGMNGKPRWLNSMGVPPQWATQSFWRDRSSLATHEIHARKGQHALLRWKPKKK